MTALPFTEIADLNDERLLPYRDLRHRNWTSLSGLFIAEGPLLVERLIASDYNVHSVLLDRKYLEHYADRMPADCQVMIVPHELVEQVVGFNFHRGIRGCGLRKPQLTIAEDFAESIPQQGLDRSATMLGIVGIQDPENVGGILRICAGLGIQQVIIGPGTADPLSRRVLRVSMGNAFRLQLYRSTDMVADMRWLKENFEVESIATSLEEGSQALETCCRSGPTLLLVGNEKAGLPLCVQHAADHRVRIDMQLGTDSLNVTVATGIIAHYYCRLAD